MVINKRDIAIKKPEYRQLWFFHLDSLLDHLFSLVRTYQTGRALCFLSHNLIGYALSQSGKNKLFWEALKVFLGKKQQHLFQMQTSLHFSIFHKIIITFSL